MRFSDRQFGFSTGAIAKGDFHQALRIVHSLGIKAVELSALRDHELPKLIQELPQLDLGMFTHVSIHAPSKFVTISEVQAADLLKAALRLGIGVVVHPDAITDASCWKEFGELLWIENLDKRKPLARTVSELEEVFRRFPNAGFCLDVAHARQIDPTMSEAAHMLEKFDDRLKQLHASGLNSNSTHSALSVAARAAFGQISQLIPPHVPVILESPVTESQISSELEFARTTFSPWLRTLRSDIDGVFNFWAPSLRRIQLESFLSVLEHSGTQLRNFPEVVRRLPTGGFYARGDVFQNTARLLELLSPSESEDLREHLNDSVEKAAKDFPELAERFKQQFV